MIQYNVNKHLKSAKLILNTKMYHSIEFKTNGIEAINSDVKSVNDKRAKKSEAEVDHSNNE